MSYQNTVTNSSFQQHFLATHGSVEFLPIFINDILLPIKTAVGSNLGGILLDLFHFVFVNSSELVLDEPDYVDTTKELHPLQELRRRKRK